MSSRNIQKEDNNPEFGMACATFPQGTGVEGEGANHTNMWCAGSDVVSSTEPLYVWDKIMDTDGQIIHRSSSLERGDGYNTQSSGHHPPDADFFRTGCFMGERSKRPAWSNNNSVLCPSTHDTLIASQQVASGVLSSIIDDPSWAGVVCEDNLDGPGKCNTYKPEPPVGWMDDDRINEDSSNCESTLQWNIDMIDDLNVRACRYAYIKDWDTVAGDGLNIDHTLGYPNNTKDVPGTYWGYPKYWGGWQTAGSVGLDQVSSGKDVQGYYNLYSVDIGGGVIQPRATYNKNKIPISRMECCLGKQIGRNNPIQYADFVIDPREGNPSDYTTMDRGLPLYNLINTIQRTQQPRDIIGDIQDETFYILGDAHPINIEHCPIDGNKLKDYVGTTGNNGDTLTVNDPNDDDVNAYTPDSKMCGANNNYNGADMTFDIKRGTPPYWCSYDILNGTSNKPNIKAERKDGSNERNFYGYDFDISNFDRYWSLLKDNLCNSWTDLDEVSLGDTAQQDEYRKKSLAYYLSPFYLWISHQLANDTNLKPLNVGVSATEELNSINRSDLGEISPGDNGYTFDVSNDYGKYMNLLNHERAHEFLKFSNDADRQLFNENMVTFCNRPDIFNFKDYRIDGNRHYNTILEDKYNRICSCYWDKNVDNTPPDQFDKIHQAIMNYFDDPQTNPANQFFMELRDNLQLDLKNQCWFNNCIANNHLNKPYKPGTTDLPRECPNICTAVSLSTCIQENSGTIIGDINYDCDANANCGANDSPLNFPSTMEPVSSMSDLLDVSKDGGIGPDSDSINEKKIIFIISIFIILIIIIFA